MSGRLVVRELAVVVTAHNHNPTILNPDFLQRNQIVPEAWQVQGPPITTPAVSQVQFANGLSVVCELTTLTVVETLEEDERARSPEVARRLLLTLPHVDYRAVGVNPRGHVLPDDAGLMPSDYIVETLLASGPWRSIGEHAEAEIRFRFRLNDCTLNLTVEDAALEGDESRHVLLLTGNFHSDMSGDSLDDRVRQAAAAIDLWEERLSFFEQAALRLVAGAEGAA